MEIIRTQLRQADDLTKIALAAKRHWNYPEKWVQLWLPFLTISPEYILEYETWMAVTEGSPIAFYSLKQIGENLWLDNLWVLPEYMRHEIGKGLFEHALERGRVRGVSVLRIEADPYAGGFYEKMGAHIIGERRADVDGQPRVLPILEMRL